MKNSLLGVPREGSYQEATAIEYGLIAALIAVGIIVGATALGSGLQDMFGNHTPAATAGQPAPAAK